MIILTMSAFPPAIVRASRKYLTERGCSVNTTRSERALSAYRGHELTLQERQHLGGLESEYDTNPTKFRRKNK